MDLAVLVKENRSMAERIVPLLLEPNATEGHIARLSEIIRMRAGFAANELGVLLEETNEIEAAWQVYSQARRIDPMNISAAINGYALVRAFSIHPEAQERLRADIQSLVALRSHRVHGLTGILQSYGTICHPAFYQQQAAMWSARGAGTVANEKQQKALALSEQTGASALVENALFYGHADDYAKAETCYLAALEKDATHPGALTGIVTLMLIRHKPAEAEKWVQRALAAGVGEEALLHQNITLLILKKDLERARALLKEATKKYPADLRYWTLLADLTLNEGDTKTVEHSILPKMEKALSTPNHFLVHMVRGLLLRKKGPGSYKQARLSLINALACNAAMPEIWHILLELDMALGDPASTEADARRLLAADPDHALANYLMGSILLARGAWQESEDFLRRSIEKHPTATACNDLAENLRRQKKLSEAERLVRQALTSDPAHVHAFDTLACILFDAGQYVDAVQAAAKAVTAQPDNPAYQLTLLRAQIRLGNKDGVRQRQQALARLRAEIPEPLQQEIRDMK
jgi:tetratricopeptide (TPR) repeat protein